MGSKYLDACVLDHRFFVSVLFFSFLFFLFFFTCFNLFHSSSLFSVFKLLNHIQHFFIFFSQKTPYIFFLSQEKKNPLFFFSRLFFNPPLIFFLISSSILNLITPEQKIAISFPLFFSFFFLFLLGETGRRGKELSISQDE